MEGGVGVVGWVVLYGGVWCHVYIIQIAAWSTIYSLCCCVLYITFLPGSEFFATKNMNFKKLILFLSKKDYLRHFMHL